MISEHWKMMKGLVGDGYAQQAEQARNSRTKQITSLLTQRRLPDHGWDDDNIQLFLQELALGDTNNFQGNVGVGEREGRVISDLVKRRHFGMAHGIGRSGDVMAEQPKAAGSSVLVALTRYLVLDAIHLCGIRAAKHVCLLPAATGLALQLTFLALRQLRPQGKYVVWSRIDQKTCFKAIGASGLTAIVIELRQEEGSDALCTDLDGIREAIERVGPDNVLCVCSTTSTFAPRVPDSVDEIAKICADKGVAHVINNAYGLQCSKICHLVETACRVGRVDAFVQSTDKNFCVPVGGAVIVGSKPEVIDKVSNMYPGRASASPIVDLFITLVHLGASGWKDLLKQRKDHFVWFQEQLKAVVEPHGCSILRSPGNKISLAVSLRPLVEKVSSGGDVTYLGSMLFTRRVSGPRVVLCVPTGPDGEVVESDGEVPKVKGKKQSIDGFNFVNYGAHSNNYNECYLTAAVAMGATREELEIFLSRLDQSLKEFLTSAGTEKGSSPENAKKKR